MAHVLSIVAFRCKEAYRDAFLKSAREILKPFWESHGSESYEVYAEIGPTGPTGRIVEVHRLKDREAYARMSEYVRTVKDLPGEPYRFLHEPEFRVLEARV
jgi:hypothetical protein